jgi:hypothetical protein
MSGGRDERKVSSLAELSAAIEPARDLWPQIEARINAARSASVAPLTDAAPRSRVVPLRWLAAAAMVASVALGVWIGRNVLPLGRPGAGGGSPLAAANTSAVLADAPTLLDAAYVSDPRYQHERAALLRAVQAQIAAMPPAAREKLVASLEAIRRAKEDLQSALGKDPGNALLQELLVNTYQDEMRVLSDVQQASSAGRGI